ncbi:hypothetical protein AAC387_Pa03g0746 [Persea americana]
MPLLSNEYLQAEFSYLRSQFPNRKISPFLFFGILTNSLWALNSTLDTYVDGAHFSPVLTFSCTSKVRLFNPICRNSLAP